MITIIIVIITIITISTLLFRPEPQTLSLKGAGQALPSPVLGLKKSIPCGPCMSACVGQPEESDDVSTYLKYPSAERLGQKVCRGRRGTSTSYSSVPQQLSEVAQPGVSLQHR